MTATRTARDEIAAVAARLVAEEGLPFAAAKRRSAKELGLGRGAPMPDDLELEEALRDYLALFQSDSQPQELRAMRELALRWMEQLAPFRPHLAGAVWLGTATRLNDIEIDLYCDDTKMVEMTLIDRQVRYSQGGGGTARRDPHELLSVAVTSQALGVNLWVHLRVHPHDALRGALRADARGRPARGDAAALRQKLADGDRAT